MTSDLFGIWLKELNRKMAKEKRSILLTVDNASCHNSGIELELSNVKVQFLPKNTTSIMQPLDMGIIAATKVLFRKKMCKAMITELDKNAFASASDLSKKLTLLQGIEFFVEAWNEVSVATIANCWRKSGLCFGPEQQEEVVEIDIALDNEIYAQIDKEDFDRWVNCDANLETGPSEFSTDDQIVADVQDKYGDHVSDTDEEIEVQEDPISSSEAMKHIEGLEKYLMQENNSGDSSADLLALKRIKRHLTSKIPFKPKQSSIERFFK